LALTASLPCFTCNINAVVITGSSALNAKLRYLRFSGCDFEVLGALPGQHVPPMGVKFGVKEWTKGLLAHGAWQSTPIQENKF